MTEENKQSTEQLDPLAELYVSREKSRVLLGDGGNQVATRVTRLVPRAVYSILTGCVHNSLEIHKNDPELSKLLPALVQQLEQLGFKGFSFDPADKIIWQCWRQNDLYMPAHVLRERTRQRALILNVLFR